MSYTEHPLPDPLPARACRSDDLLRDYVSDGREYRGHRGSCMNCGAEYKESDDSDLSNTHWMHVRKVGLAVWERDTDPVVVALCRVMDPDDPGDAMKHAERLLAHGPIMMG
jgi:hypothetical protein